MSHTKTETGTIQLNPADLTKAGAVSLHGGVLTVKNDHLADLIHTKIADAAKLAPSLKATDVDVSVGVKVK